MQGVIQAVMEAEAEARRIVLEAQAEAERLLAAARLGLEEQHRRSDQAARAAASSLIRTATERAHQEKNARLDGVNAELERELQLPTGLREALVAAAAHGVAAIP